MQSRPRAGKHCVYALSCILPSSARSMDHYHHPPAPIPWQLPFPPQPVRSSDPQGHKLSANPVIRLNSQPPCAQGFAPSKAVEEKQEPDSADSASPTFLLFCAAFEQLTVAVASTTTHNSRANAFNLPPPNCHHWNKNYQHGTRWLTRRPRGLRSRRRWWQRRKRRRARRGRSDARGGKRRGGAGGAVASASSNEADGSNREYDGSCKNTPQTYVNAAFESCYLQQQILDSPDEWKALMHAFRQPLPTTFRISSRVPLAIFIEEVMSKQWVPFLSGQQRAVLASREAATLLGLTANDTALASIGVTLSAPATSAQADAVGCRCPRRRRQRRARQHLCSPPTQNSFKPPSVAPKSQCQISQFPPSLTTPVTSLESLDIPSAQTMYCFLPISAEFETFSLLLRASYLSSSAPLGSAANRRPKALYGL
ncbi:hypothetical protein V8E36_006416 [Tilletia maclaganii]